MKLRLFSCAGIALISACRCSILWSNITSYYNDIALEQLAQRLGVSPTYANIAGYVNKSVHNGMSRKEVETVLNQIAPIEVTKRGELTERGGIGPHVCDDLRLVVGPFNSSLPFSACYYGEGDSLFNWQYNEW